MTYKDHFDIAVKCKGKILRVQDDFVRLPFGSEYSLYLKNLNSRRCAVKISIDGEDALDYKSLILDANSSTELEGFLNGSTARNRFKFIQKTKQIQEHRGDKIDDGMIRIEFAYEKVIEGIVESHHHYHYDSPFHWNYNNHFDGNSTIKYDSFYSNTMGETSRGVHDGAKCASFESNVTMDSLGVVDVSKPLVDEGITVKGSECNQQFNYSSIGELDAPEVIIIRLKGISGNTTVTRPVTVSSKLTCSSCGKKSKSSSKFCPECGTFLK